MSQWSSSGNVLRQMLIHIKASLNYPHTCKANKGTLQCVEMSFSPRLWTSALHKVWSNVTTNAC